MSRVCNGILHAAIVCVCVGMCTHTRPSRKESESDKDLPESFSPRREHKVRLRWSLFVNWARNSWQHWRNSPYHVIFLLLLVPSFFDPLPLHLLRSLYRTLRPFTLPALKRKKNCPRTRRRNDVELNVSPTTSLQCYLLSMCIVYGTFSLSLSLYPPIRIRIFLFFLHFPINTK